MPSGEATSNMSTKETKAKKGQVGSLLPNIASLRQKAQQVVIINKQKVVNSYVPVIFRKFGFILRVIEDQFN